MGKVVRTCPVRLWQGTAVSRVGYELNVLAPVLLYRLLCVFGRGSQSMPIYATYWGREQYPSPRVSTKIHWNNHVPAQQMVATIVTILRFSPAKSHLRADWRIKIFFDSGELGGREKELRFCLWVSRHLCAACWHSGALVSDPTAVIAAPWELSQVLGA